MENATDKQIAFLAKNKIDASQMDKQEAHKLIADLLNKPEVIAPMYKPGEKPKFVSNDAYETMMAKSVVPKTNSQSSYFVAYAKDLYIAQFDKVGMADMQNCIDMIKLAKEQL